MTTTQNDPRIGGFRRNNRLESLLKEVNDLLATCQEQVNQQYERPRFPLLLLMGAPHSGTTLFMQWLAESRQWAYPTNFISRFYAAPYVGARIQQMLIENDYYGEIADFKKTSPFSSTLGKTAGALAPHEFWYFWRRFFPLKQDADVVPLEDLARVDVKKLNREIASFEGALEKPLAMKAMLLNWHIPFLDSAFNKVLFVNLKRNPAFIVQSMLEGREKYFGSEELWYSFKPPEYAWLKNLNPVQQVAGQIHFIRKSTDDGVAHVASERTMTIHYEEFCRNPAQTWNVLVEKMAGQGYSLTADYTGRGHFDDANTIRTTPERWERIQQAIRDFAENNIQENRANH
jgi:hypothetical protein